MFVFSFHWHFSSAMDFVLVFFLNVSNFIILIHSNQRFTIPPRGYQSVGGTRSFRKFNHVLFESCATRHSSGSKIGANQKQDDGNVEHHNNLQIIRKRKLHWQLNSPFKVCDAAAFSWTLNLLGNCDDKYSDIRVALHCEGGSRRGHYEIEPIKAFEYNALFDTKRELERVLFKTKQFIHVQLELYW